MKTKKTKIKKAQLKINKIILIIYNYYLYLNNYFLQFFYNHAIKNLKNYSHFHI